ncbi:Crp/Fnr family transcriptional regulator [Rhizobium etli]|uniref:Crp/Fnr family transcriptional regulator n=1 Tax=Rhizobium etli TaxID=29449 RepID=UPI000383A7D2|nr:Crp/Fnr family transcriptional regulator [Rhizobium etli]AGS26597.1 Crp family transcriptional regulator protein [Rhizobium etli bv. mimosae str. Mim1]
MLQKVPPMFRNELLNSFSDEMRWLEADLQPVKLDVGDILVEPDAPIQHVHFIERGIVAAVTTTQGGRSLEVFSVGREGMTGVSVLLGADRTSWRSFVQEAGSAIRIPAWVIREAAERSPSLRERLLRYAHSVMVQLAETALALGHYSLNQRLARLILMSHDRAGSDELLMTHEFVAMMLGVRRAGVSTALAFLEGEGMIRSTRGKVSIRNRSKLVAMAGGSYNRFGTASTNFYEAARTVPTENAFQAGTNQQH